MNVHGLWNGKGKEDSPSRIKQSNKIKQFLHEINEPKILCGDFNLRPDTHSLKIIQGKMRSLIQEYNIQDTRTKHCKKTERFADYVFISSDLTVKNFSLLSDIVSDHAPLLCDID